MNLDLINIRGLPGSGKTTFAELIAPYSNVAADEFFLRADGTYHYDKDLLSRAHAWCQAITGKWMSQGYHVIAVHNTFAQNQYIAPYLKLAELHKYKVTIIKMEQQFKSIHNVPEKSISRMALRWEELL